MARENRFAEIEGMLYSYGTSRYLIENLRIDIALSKLDNDSEREKYLLAMLNNRRQYIDQVNCMLKYINVNSSEDYELISLRYLKGMEWEEIEDRLHICVRQLIRRKNEIMKTLCNLCYAFRISSELNDF